MKRRCIGKAVKNGGVTPDKSQYDVGDEVRYYCSAGYILTDAISSNECTSDGSWRYPVPDCKGNNSPGKATILQKLVQVFAQGCMRCKFL